MVRARAFAIRIPPDTEKNVLKGVTARPPIYVIDYFILFNRSLQGLLVQCRPIPRMH